MSSATLYFRSKTETSCASRIS